MEHPYLPKYVRDERPWGFFEQFTHGEPTTVKIIVVRAGEALSLQSHEKRDEFWRVLDGEGTITVGDTYTQARAGDEFFIPRGTKHRAEGGVKDLRFLEIAFGEFEEGDIVRYEDRYQRVKEVVGGEEGVG